jgi:uncharacterized DUF497 family protein
MNAAVEISFDPVKDAANIRKHGIPLAYGAVVLESAIGEVEDIRYVYGETRLKAFAEINGRWFGCAYTMRDAVPHIVTIPRMRRNEVMKWLKKSPSG